ncbi:tRNA pseudouridine(55) synthase TruB [Candidatus Uhrbacteria bacterium RIFCSPHIGHO2_12_FULL_60_25]|uniref:tRNA pseudouridine synthase B n=1 Tax=Candidatus Uhrbacteria bacterium RIFCSPHIGHO2_12_FULL_60_25 TaxID=1802399 RepID=A0A1F7UJD9_9BACT|nr:MAG: tRNA pseudouridine(55) synthase TruB [Candidatus Uhrbacteria bacterium RIFCSPHIGHO2_02_FULL_60_44]OGL78390.1 MAG: tRNA pseudouridine(55) synthase TruB [Candidatus Uhrbacteria bacterium RIFCSPHIGHO2_12_FULL_60_25]
MDGLLLIDKPPGITSHDAVDAVRRIAKTRRVGHAGTLDPFATGLLVIGINKGTKTLTGLVGLDKTYEATARLGATSTTDDPEGAITVRADCVRPDQDEVEAALKSFRSSYLQTAPAYSAKKVGGKKLYELARAGRAHEVELPKKTVTISELVILNYTWPNLHFRVSCSSGTYIRALARDIGEMLGVGAYLTELRRTNIGPYDLENAIRLSDLNTDTIGSHLIPV